MKNPSLAFRADEGLLRDGAFRQTTYESTCGDDSAWLASINRNLRAFRNVLEGSQRLQIRPMAQSLHIVRSPSRNQRNDMVDMPVLSVIFPGHPIFEFRLKVLPKIIL